MYRAYKKGIPPNIYKMQSCKDIEIIHQIENAFEERKEQLDRMNDLSSNYKHIK